MKAKIIKINLVFDQNNKIIIMIWFTKDLHKVNFTVYEALGEDL